MNHEDLVVVSLSVPPSVLGGGWTWQGQRKDQKLEDPPRSHRSVRLLSLEKNVLAVRAASAIHDATLRLINGSASASGLGGLGSHRPASQVPQLSSLFQLPSDIITITSTSAFTNHYYHYHYNYYCWYGQHFSCIERQNYMPVLLAMVLLEQPLSPLSLSFWTFLWHLTP